MNTTCMRGATLVSCSTCLKSNTRVLRCTSRRRISCTYRSHRVLNDWMMLMPTCRACVCVRVCEDMGSVSSVSVGRTTQQLDIWRLVLHPQARRIAYLCAEVSDCIVCSTAGSEGRGRGRYGPQYGSCARPSSAGSPGVSTVREHHRRPVSGEIAVEVILEA